MLVIALSSNIGDLSNCEWNGFVLLPPSKGDSLDLLITEPPLLHFVTARIICSLEGDRISPCISVWPGLDYSFV